MITKRKKWIMLLSAVAIYSTGMLCVQERLPEPLTIKACYVLARAQYPLIRQQKLIEKTRAYTLKNVAKGYWPQLSVAGQASYQSDVTALPVSLPGIDGPSLSKDQYKLFGEVTQTICDNGIIRSQQQISEAAAQTEQQRTEAELYKLRERISQLFFGVLMADAQLARVALLKADIIRPELRIYELQKTGFETQEKLLKARSSLRLGLFVQGGAGRPALNFLSNEFEPYYIGGLRLSRNIGSYYTLKHDRELLDMHKQGADVQRDIFLFSTKLGIQQYSAEIRKLEELLAADEEIVQLRSHVKAAAAAQLSNGVITCSDYLREANAEDQARQDKALHGLQLLLAQFNYQTTTGN